LLSFFPSTNISFLVSSSFPFGTLRKELQAEIITAIRINNDIFVVWFLKGCEIFNSKVHYFYG
jgi:hypothetical protein